MSKSHPLSQREFDCLYFAAMGLNAKQTALHLSISHETVNFYKKNILRKLNCSTMTQAVYYAIRNNILPI